MKHNPTGFTLIEMLLATALSAVLMSAVLTILAALSRDLVRFDQASATPSAAPLIEHLRWDLRNASMMSQSADGLTLTGHGGIDPRTFTPNGRPARVTYRSIRDGGRRALVREQEYLDDLVQPHRWRAIVMIGASDVIASADLGPAGDTRDPSTAQPAAALPARVRIHVDMPAAAAEEVIATR